MTRLTTKTASVLGLSLALSLASVESADARRGGSFGSRGMRTYSAPPITRTAPRAAAPVQRSMTPTTPANRNGAQPGVPAAGAAAQAPARRGFLGGMGGGLLGGLVAGGLLGMMLGHGFGGLNAGLMNTLMQLAVVGLGAWLLMSLFRRRQQPAAAAPVGFGRDGAFAAGAAPVGPAQGFGSNLGMFGGGAAAQPARSAPTATDLGLVQADRDAFERLLTQVQDAFGREDYAALRAVTTPEIMSYLSEELSQNATHGRRNEVSATRLLQADVAEAWSEDEDDYATAALRYEGIDVMRDRSTGAVVDGDPERPTETTELWTFVRHAGGDWKLSAIQEA